MSHLYASKGIVSLVIIVYIFDESIISCFKRVPFQTLSLSVLTHDSATCFTKSAEKEGYQSRLVL